MPFEQWDTVFPNAECAVASIDGLTHHAEIISIDGESYCKRQAEQTQKPKQIRTETVIMPRCSSTRSRITRLYISSNNQYIGRIDRTLTQLLKSGRLDGLKRLYQNPDR